MSLRGRMNRMRSLTRRLGVVLHEATYPMDMRAVLARVLEQPPKTLVVCGGDGTLQGVVTLLAEQFNPAHCPRLLVLGGGRTNYTARDLGTHKHLIDLLDRLLEAPQTLSQSTRHTLCVRQEGQPNRHGFLLAGALVDHVIRDCHRFRLSGSSRLRRGHFSTPIRLTQLAALSAIGKCRYASPMMRIRAAALGEMSGPVRLLLMTSLDHRFSSLQPFAARGEGSLRIAAVKRDARSFWLRLPRILRGRHDENMLPESGYLSGQSQAIEICGMTSVCLDGQQFCYPADKPIAIEPGIGLEFLHP